MKRLSFLKSILLITFLGVPLSYQAVFAQTWTPEWTNSGNHVIGSWTIGSSDKYISGYFTNGGGRSDLMSINSSGAAQLNGYFVPGPAWSIEWSNSSNNGQIGNGQGSYWGINSDDVYSTINSTGQQSYLLAVNNRTRWSMVLLWGGSYWNISWGNSGQGVIGNWTINNTDQYVGARFYGTSAQALFVCSSSGWAMIQSYPWSSMWSNGGNGYIGGWHISSSDRYIPLDWNQDGLYELLCINPSNGWATILSFNGSTWNSQWSNSGNGYIGTWHIGSADNFLQGKVDGTTASSVVMINSSTRWASLLKYSTSGWSTLWGNSGNGSIFGWNIDGNDRYLVDNFASAPTQNRLQLINVANGYATTMYFTPQQPVSVTVSGPSSLTFKQQGTYTANVSGGSGNVSYQWYYSTSGGSTWTTQGTARTQVHTMINYDFIMRCDVHDNGTGGNASATEYVSYGNGAVMNPQKDPEISRPLPTKYDVGNYPNPFNPSTTISFQLVENANVRLDVFDVMGRKVVSLEDGLVAAGYHSVQWKGANESGSSVASGMYFYRIIAEPVSGQHAFIATGKMLLMK